MSQKTTHSGLSREHFLRNMQKPKNEFGLHRRVRIAYEPILWKAPCDPKFMENKKTLKKLVFLHTMLENLRKLFPKGVQKGEVEKGVAPLGPPLVP